MQMRLLTNILILLCLISVSCRDGFTEEDALRAQQEIDLAIFVVDLGSDSRPPVVGATVSINQGGEVLTATTNDNGVVQFNNIKIGSVVYTIEATNYLTITGSASVNPNSIRVSQEVLEVGTYSTDNTQDMAIVKGQITIETDVTNLSRENAEGVTVTLQAIVDGKTFEFQAVTDAEGKYEIMIPVFAGTTVTYQMSVPDIELDQTIAINKFQDEPGTFLQENPVLPRIEQLPTVFSVFRLPEDAARSVTLNDDVRSMYALADPPPSGGTRALVSGVTTNPSGEITFLAFASGGDYTGDADGIVRIEIVGLLGGSGGILDIPLGGETNLIAAYNAALAGGQISFPVGSGYTPNSTGTNDDLNLIAEAPGSEATLFGNFISLQLFRGAVVYQDMYYGTGISRERFIQ